MMENKSLEEQLKVLLAEREIRHVLLRYCRGVDRCDAELIASCYHEDAIDDHGNWQVSGKNAPNAIISRVAPGPESAMHFMGNILIEVEGDTAYSESYVLAFRTDHQADRAYTRTRAIRFVDKFSYRNNVWRISERVVVDDWNRIDEVMESMADTPLFRPSSKSSNDPVYTIRNGPVARQPPTA